MPLLSTQARNKRVSGSAPAPYSDDVFATLLYTGTGAAQTFYPGFTDMDKGYMFMSRYRSGAPTYTDASLWDDKRGLSSQLRTTLTAVQAAVALSGVTSNNLTIGATSQNTINVPYVSYFWKLAKSFFTTVVYSGNNQTTRSIPHDLQCDPGMVICKSVSGAATQWNVWHRAAGGSLLLNDTGAQTTGFVGVLTANASYVTVDSSFNSLNSGYELFIFAHDISDNGVIRCDSFTTDSTGNATVNVGFDVQFLLVKIATGAAGNWQACDIARGITNSVSLNTTTAEANVSGFSPYNSGGVVGFTVSAAGANRKFVYMAVRKRNKPNTSPNTLTINGGNSIDVYSQAIANGWDQVSPLNVVVAADVGSDSTATAALIFNGSYPDVTLTVNSGVYVCGRGGLGTTNAIGQPGGPALKTTGAIKVINNGVIAGGGGGGGGYYRGSTYGYGGNGAGLPLLGPLGVGTSGTQATMATKTNGGNGAYGVSAAGNNTGGIGGVAGSPGSTGGSGSGGGGGLGAAGGASSPTGSGYTYSDPGNNGQGGAGLTDSDATYASHPTYAGGAAGPYAQGNANITWLTLGTRYGAAA